MKGTGRCSMKGRCGEGPPPFVLLQPYLLDEITVGTASEEFGKFPSHLPLPLFLLLPHSYKYMIQKYTLPLIRSISIDDFTFIRKTDAYEG